MGLGCVIDSADGCQVIYAILSLLFIGAGIGVLAVGLAIILGILLGDE